MSSSDTDHDPALGAWNTVQCRSNTYLILPLNEQNANGVVVAVDIFPISGGTYPQLIFALRNSVNLAVTLTFELGEDLQPNIWQNLTEWKRRVTPTAALTNSNLFSKFM